MLDPELRRNRLAFVSQLDEPALDVEDVNHFRRVLRMNEGDVLNVSDGVGRWRPTALGVEGSDLTPLGQIQVVEPTERPLCVAFAPTKGDRPEWTVRKLTELGVDRIVPLVTQRSVVRWSGVKAEKVRLRWVKSSREAGMQSRRVFLPTIEPVVGLSDFLRSEPEAVVCDPDGSAITSSVHTVIIGPEGGFTAGEVHGVKRVRLPFPGVLCTETAAVAASALLSSVRYS